MLPSPLMPSSPSGTPSTTRPGPGLAKVPRIDADAAKRINLRSPKGPVKLATAAKTMESDCQTRVGGGALF